MKGDVFVTGGSGFVGAAVIEQLLAAGYGVRALAHSRSIDPHGGRVQSIKADLFDRTALAAAMSGCTAVIHLVGIIFERPSAGVTFQRMHVEATRCAVDAAKSAGVGRYVHMSALGTRDNAVSQYHCTKYEAEQYVRASDLDWTIVRPSMIHGPRGDFMRMEAAWARRRSAPFLFMPYFGRGVVGLGGAGRLQPVDVRDVARAFVEAIDKPQTIQQTYALAGDQVLTWPQMHRLASEQIVGRRRATAPIPAWYAKLLARIVPGRWLPFNRDQVIMSQEDNTADPAELDRFRRDFGWTPRPFTSALSDYANQL
jgi:NADH dehydrogenase